MSARSHDSSWDGASGRLLVAGNDVADDTGSFSGCAPPCHAAIDSAEPSAVSKSARWHVA